MRKVLSVRMLNKKHILIYILIAGIIFIMPACTNVADNMVSMSATPTKSPNFKAPDLPENMDHEPPQGMGFDISNEDIFERVITPFNTIRSQAHTSTGHRQMCPDLT